MKIKSIPALAASILICQLAGIIGSFFTYPSIGTWYASLAKPFFTPPGWLFGPAWITLYTLMGIAAYIVWEKGFQKPGVRRALGIFAVQLSLNALWSIIFFGARELFAAFVEILALWAFILASIAVFYRIDRRAGLLLIPYIIWVSFAALLNFYVWILN